MSQFCLLEHETKSCIMIGTEGNDVRQQKLLNPTSSMRLKLAVTESRVSLESSIHRQTSGDFTA